MNAAPARAARSRPWRMSRAGELVAVMAAALALMPTMGAAQLQPQPQSTSTPPWTSPSTSPSTAAGAGAGAQLRQQEIATCLAGEQYTWGDGRDRAVSERALVFAYRHDGAPIAFGADQVMTLARQAATAWSACGIPARVVLLARDAPTPEGAIQLLWSDTGSRGQFGLANVPARSLSMAPSMFRLLRERNPRHPAEQTLQMVLSHEMGHFYGLMAHSRRCVDVMSYYDDGKGQRCTLREPSAWGSVVEYRSMLPTACDIARCKAVNAR